MLLPVLFFVIIGAFFGIALTLVAKFFSVGSNIIVEKILEKLPGINCGACGFASCRKYAEAIVEEKTAPGQCKPGGEDVANEIGGILGKEVESAEPSVAYVHCSGQCGEKYNYKGTDSCKAAELYYMGKDECGYGCIGLGDCADVCHKEAITIKNGKAIVSPMKCDACGMCAKVCPKGLITIQKARQSVFVTCHSHDKGKRTKEVCESGCIGCRICEKNCPKKAILVKDNLAVIDGELCHNCGLCVQKCPQKCITVLKRCE